MFSFTKMQGLGNDFIVFDGTQKPVVLSKKQIQKISDRHFGIGCDQVLLIEPPKQPNIDFHYRIFNADGNEIEQCGNGARCVAKYIQRNLSNKPSITVSTMKGVLTLSIKDDIVMVDMGLPRFLPTDIPLDVSEQKSHYHVDIEAESIQFSALSLGNPHCVIEVEDIANAPVQAIGKALVKKGIFPQGANVGFMQKITKDTIALRVFERGVGETLACGSGACAAAVVAIRDHKAHSPLTVQLPGGNLRIQWQPNSPVMMEGPAEVVFSGEIML